MEVKRMSQVKAKNKKTGITYVYESESYWDKEKKQPRNRRKLIGKIDELTGKVVPTRGKAKKESQDDPPESSKAYAEFNDMRSSYEKQIAGQADLIRSQASEIAKLRAEKKETARKLMELAKSCEA
jgi:hypothetical protein